MSLSHEAAPRHATGGLTLMADMAAWMSAHGACLIEADSPPSTASVGEYWAAARGRRQLWSVELQRFGSVADAAACDPLPALEGLVVEMLVAELLSGVCAAVLSAVDQRHDVPPISPVALRVHRDLIDLRIRSGRAFEDADVPDRMQLRFARLRRQLQLWNDVLIAPYARVLRRELLAELTFDEDRVRDFGEDCDVRCVHSRSELTQAGLRLAIPGGPIRDPLRAQAHAAVVQAMLGLFPTTAFDPRGGFKSRWQTRIQAGQLRSDRALLH